MPKILGWATPADFESSHQPSSRKSENYLGSYKEDEKLVALERRNFELEQKLVSKEHELEQVRMMMHFIHHDNAHPS